MLYYCLDVNKDGWITYQLYFLFLKYYFGSLSEAAKDTKNPYDLSSTNVDNSELSPWDRFIKLLHDQLRVKFLIYDSNQNNLFEED